MGTPRAELPQPLVLAQEYTRPGVSYETLGVKYGCSASTVRNRLREWAQETGREWPLKPHTQTRGQNRDTVSSALVVSEVEYACSKLRITQSTLARLAGMTENHLHKITSGKVTTIMRATQGKILETISKIESGEIKHVPEKVILPMSIRDRCPSNHPYTGRRHPETGRRICSVCQADKHRRRDELKQARTA